MARCTTQKWMMKNWSKSIQTWVLLSFSHPNINQVQLNSKMNTPNYTGFVSFLPLPPPIAKALACGQKLALAPFFLGGFYWSLHLFSTQPKISWGGPLWFIQLWIYSYFPELAPSPWIVPEPVTNGCVDEVGTFEVLSLNTSMFFPLFTKEGILKILDLLRRENMALENLKSLTLLFLLTIKLPCMLAFLSLKIWFSWVIRMPSRGIITFGCEEIWPYSNHPSVICLDY